MTVSVSVLRCEANVEGDAEKLKVDAMERTLTKRLERLAANVNPCETAALVNNPLKTCDPNVTESDFPTTCDATSLTVFPNVALCELLRLCDACSDTELAAVNA